MAILRFSPLVLAKFGKLLLIIVVDNSWTKIGFLVELVQTSSLIESAPPSNPIYQEAFERFTEMKKQKPASKASKKEAKLLKRKERVSQKSENENEQPGDDAEGTTSAKHSRIMDKPNTGLFSLRVYYHRHSQILRTIVFYISCLIWDLHFLALKGSDFFKYLILMKM